MYDGARYFSHETIFDNGYCTCVTTVPASSLLSEMSPNIDQCTYLELAHLLLLIWSQHHLSHTQLRSTVDSESPKARGLFSVRVCS